MFPFSFTFRFQKPLLISLALLLSCVAVRQMPVEWGYENSLVENVQMAVLAAGMLLCLFARRERRLYRFAAMVFLLMMLREVSYGRTIFFAVPGEVDTFYKWSEIPYGWVAHVLVGLYMAYMALYFILNRLYKPLWGILTEIRIPLVTAVVMLVSMVVATVMEKMELAPAEEMAELAFYVALVTAVYSYTRDTLPKAAAE